jgi:hypothetical protein
MVNVMEISEDGVPRDLAELSRQNVQLVKEHLKHRNAYL